MIRKGGMVMMNPFSESFKRKMTSKTPSAPVYFGPFEVTSQVFLKTPHSFALVNLKPLLPGHVLVSPLKPHQRLTDLSPPELTDLFGAVQRVQAMLARHYFTSSSARAINGPGSPPTTPYPPSVPGTPAAPPPGPDAGSFNIAVQDGREAGQTVPHLHVHVIPRIRGATAKAAGPGDEIYELMAAEEGNVGGALWDREVSAAVAEKGRPQAGGGFPRIEDQARKPRTQEEMVDEAEKYMGVLAEMEREDHALDGFLDGGSNGNGNGNGSKA